MIVAGIDPGKNGAMFVWEHDDDGAEDRWSIHPVPLISYKKPGHKTPSTKPDYALWLGQWSAALLPADYVFIELVGGGGIQGRQQGGVGMFNFGYTAGFARGLIQHLPHRFLTPQSWKKIVGLKGSDAEESRAKASELFPKCVDFWPLKKHDGRAEAALIAYAGTTILNGEKDVGQTHRRRPDLSAAACENEQDGSRSRKGRGRQRAKLPAVDRGRKGKRSHR